MNALGRSLLPLWALEEGITFLNHGSYGATPRDVTAEADRWRARLESQPVRFFNDELPAAIRHAATRLAGFVGVPADRLGFVENASDGTNAVLRSVRWREGDEILTTSHVYNAVRKNLAWLASMTGIVAVEAQVPFPTPDGQCVVDAIERAITPRTRLILVDHIASASAVVLPLPSIVALARAHGIPVLVDGAHGPGMMDLDIEALGADWYVGNCHKWLCSPKGSAFIAVSANPAWEVHPTVISHNYGQGFAAEFDKIGTRDYAPWLATPAAIAFHERLGGPALRARNMELARRHAVRLATELGTDTGAPTALFGSIATIRLPWDGPADWDVARLLRQRLWERHRIEMHVTALAGALWARISAAAYNEDDDYAGLAPALKDTLSATRTGTTA
ncbi:aminotransferase class V-fold PLP-dependent enzyme [Alsobacter sp. R-9]